MRLVEILGNYFYLFPVKTYIFIPSYIVIIFARTISRHEVLEFDFHTNTTYVPTHVFTIVRLRLRG